MNQHRARTLAWGVFALIVVLLIAQGVLGWLTRTNPIDPNVSWANSGFLSFVVGLPLLTFPVVGFVIALRRPESSIGWIMLAIGFGFAFPTAGYAKYALVTRGGDLPFGRMAAAIDGPSWIPFIGLAGCYLLLLFPDGHLPSPRWRWFARAVGIGMALGYIGILVEPKLESFPTIANPLAVPALEPLFFGLVAVPIGIVGAAISLVRRYRRSSGTERLQLKWLAAAASVVAAIFGATFILSFAFDSGPGPTPTWMSLLQSLSLFTFALIPAAIGFAVLKYRLYEIDVVINKTVVFGIARGVHHRRLRGDRGGRGQRSWARRTSDPLGGRGGGRRGRLPAGARTSATISPTVSSTASAPRRTRCCPSSPTDSRATYATEDVLPRMARILAEGTGAARADVWLRVGESSGPPPRGRRMRRRRAASRRDAASRGRALPGPAPGRAPRRALDREAARRPRAPRPRSKLLADLASQAGLVLRNVRLTEELIARLDELRRRASGWCRRRTRSAASSSATCTTARSSSWSRSP